MYKLRKEKLEFTKDELINHYESCKKNFAKLYKEECEKYKNEKKKHDKQMESYFYYRDLLFGILYYMATLEIITQEEWKKEEEKIEEVIQFPDQQRTNGSGSDLSVSEECVSNKR